MDWSLRGSAVSEILQARILGKQHGNMYIIYSETDHQPRLDA